MTDAAKSSSRWRGVQRVALGIAVLLVVSIALFVWNGTRTSWRMPQTGENGHTILYSDALLDARGRTLRVLALNAAKCDFHRGGLSFASRDEVRASLDRISATIAAEEPDVVCLSEIVMESGPVQLDQVADLAATTGFAYWASSENYSFGLPFLRVRSGNAVLANVELRALPVQQLAGGAPFWNPTNNRRALWFEIHVGGEWLLAASLRNDSFDPANNLRQSGEILARTAGRPVLLAGDFNAVPGSPSMELFRASGRFTGLVDGPPTFPASAPDRRLDHVLAPSTWTLVEARVVDTGASDHLAVVAVFELPR